MSTLERDAVQFLATLSERKDGVRASRKQEVRCEVRRPERIQAALMTHSPPRQPWSRNDLFSEAGGTAGPLQLLSAPAALQRLAAVLPLLLLTALNLPKTPRALLRNGALYRSGPVFVTLMILSASAFWSCFNTPNKVNAATLPSLGVRRPVVKKMHKCLLQLW